MAMNWQREGNRIVSPEGYVITRTENSRGEWFYNGWLPVELGARVIEAGYGPDGLARCKSAAERHWAAQVMCRGHLVAGQEATSRETPTR